MSHIQRSTRKTPQLSAAQADASQTDAACPACGASPTGVEDSQFTPDVKDATSATLQANEEVKNTLDFDNISDFDDADKGFVAREEDLVIYNDKNEPVWDLTKYAFVSAKPGNECPDTVNPSLWRVAQLCMNYGLYKVCHRIYQIRGYDLSNITFVRGQSGWIVFDPLVSKETAKAAFKFLNDNYGGDPLPVSAVIYSHSHIDHFGGVRGIVSQEDVDNKTVRIYAPEGFTEEAVSENVIAGNAMGRRAIYMYGSILPRGATGSVCSGLGLTVSTGEATLIVPTDLVSETGKPYTIDGVNMEFQMTPGSEAPAEMNTWFNDWHVLWMAENTTCTMHNLLTLRGAQVRDALKWATYLTETINRYGDKAWVKFQAHHWPIWGNDKIMDYLKKQRDIYKYTHDQSVRLMNLGYLGKEISENIKLPASLEKNWSTRGYYGTLSHNSHAVYQRYMGWYSGNPSDLHKHPQEYAAKKYVQYMGTETDVVNRAKADFEAGDYRWVAEVLRHVVFANDKNLDAKYLLADAYEQLGYQAESGAWRSVYLQGAFELRQGVPSSGGTTTASTDIINNMTPEMLFDYFGVNLNADKAEGQSLTVNIHFKDLKPDEQADYTLTIENSVLNYTTKVSDSPDAYMGIPKATMTAVLLGNMNVDDALNDENTDISNDDKMVLKEFFSYVEPPKPSDFWFDIVTP
ncbi:putative alkyl/aryl-sulfatase YjcS [Gracilariopsis chorda]|uniref:Putative alkyl/aryl-sulfatase YjcS n=1 Tax=Gracilariopsis chorda TaxID=448386 RepID=A0A2V3IXR7_9FLOR|nr:putative alkyl/aryl-sulfatase YjcS [Gracilariopsis chorda]|eukprot:PXF45930.1 putative alkyl/aryl-sulfatase YjcS [Gracilariopsis chorda]